MAKMRWWKLEWERKARTHKPLADPHLSAPTERERQEQRRGKKTIRKRVRRLKQRRRIAASRAQARGSFHAATLTAVARVTRERGTRDPAAIARELGI
jgi:hypothetical protein